MFWKRSKKTDFERAVKAYYKYCYRNGIIPVKPFEAYSEIADGYVFLRNQFGLIAKIFFVEKDHNSIIKKPDLAPKGFVLELR